MTLARGRVLRAAGGARPLGIAAREASGPAGVRVPAEVARSHERAALVIAAAERRALAILRDAELRAADTRLRAEELGRASGLAEAAGTLVRLRAREAELERGATDRIVELGRLLAERLVRRAVSDDPAALSGLVEESLAEARGARRVALAVHPDSAASLTTLLASLDPEGRVHTVVGDASLRPGDLRLETDVGVVDARLAPSLERLAASLRKALRHE